MPNLKERYECAAGPVVRMIADFTDHTSVYMTADFGIDTSYIWNNEMYESMFDMYENGRLFRLATTEVQDQIRFKLKETAPDIFLYTGEKKELPKKKTGGCPFGFG